MLSKSKIKFVRSLQFPKYRKKYHKIVVEGIKIISDILGESLMTLDTIYATDEWVADNADLLRMHEGELIPVTREALAQVSGFKTPQPVLGVGSPPALSAAMDAHKSALCLYLDGIGDPGNLGTILRIADWFGITDLYLSPDCADVYNPKTIQSSMSSVFRVRTRTCGLEELAGSLVIGATLSGTPMTHFQAPSSGLLVLGSESHGIRPSHLTLCTAQISIPADRSLGAESLNVAAAAAILCAHLITSQT